jgi:ATP-binding cassette, subfamily B, bacterial
LPTKTASRCWKEIDFQAQPGTVLGLLGRTGSGKTTLARLVFRLYDPTSGLDRLGGVPLTQPSLRALRERVALVTQDVQLFQATVRDNITFFNRSIPDSADHCGDRELGLTNGCAPARRPGYQTGNRRAQHLGRRGPAAGLYPRLPARPRPGDPRRSLVALDPATEQLIERAIDKLLQNRTAIIIAHRLGTLHRTMR